jgi:hypothetical protein
MSSMTEIPLKKAQAGVDHLLEIPPGLRFRIDPCEEALDPPSAGRMTKPT